MMRRRSPRRSRGRTLRSTSRPCCRRSGTPLARPKLARGWRAARDSGSGRRRRPKRGRLGDSDSGTSAPDRTPPNTGCPLRRPCRESPPRRRTSGSRGAAGWPDKGWRRASWEETLHPAPSQRPEPYLHPPVRRRPPAILRLPRSPRPSASLRLRREPVACRSAIRHRRVAPAGTDRTADCPQPQARIIAIDQHAPRMTIGIGNRAIAATAGACHDCCLSRETFAGAPLRR
jgi:hypothetical protein